MAPDVRRLLQAKNLLVLKEIVLEAHVPHAVGLDGYMAAGFPSCWTHAANGSLSWQESRSPRLRGLVGRCPVAARNFCQHRARGSGDPGWHQELCDLTMDEAEKGWLVGPSDTNTERDTRTLGPAPRFLVKQGDALRAIDDCSVCGHNKAPFVSEKVDLIGIDPLLNSAKAAVCAVTSDRPDEVVC